MTREARSLEDRFACLECAIGELREATEGLRGPRCGALTSEVLAVLIRCEAERLWLGGELTQRARPACGVGAGNHAPRERSPA